MVGLDHDALDAHASRPSSQAPPGVELVPGIPKTVGPDQGLVEVRQSQQEPDRLTVDLAKKRELWVDEIPQTSRETLEPRLVPGNVSGKDSQSAVEEGHDAADLVVPVAQVDLAHPNAAALGEALGDTMKPVHPPFAVAEAGQLYLKGDVLLAPGDKAIALGELSVVWGAVAAHQRRRAVIAFDQNAIGILIIEVQRAKERSEITIASPATGVLPQGHGHAIVGNIVVEPKDGITALEMVVSPVVDGAADGPHWLWPTPSDKALGGATAEPGAPLRVDALCKPAQHRRHPHAVAAKDAPGEGEEDPAVAPRPDRPDIDGRHGHDPCARGVAPDLRCPSDSRTAACC
jgi:hypothetical protein